MIKTSGNWLKLYRSMLAWEWYDDTNTTRVFLHCLLNAGYEDFSWRGETIARGQFVTSISDICQATNLTCQKVRTALRNLRSTGEITIKSTNKYSIITVCKFGDYQDDLKCCQPAEQQTNNKQITSKQQANNKPTTKEGKKERNNNRHQQHNAAGEYAPTSAPIPAYTGTYAMGVYEGTDMLLDRLQSPTEWSECICRKHKMTVSGLCSCLSEFRDSLVARNQTEAKTETEWKQHFDSWLSVRKRADKSRTESADGQSREDRLLEMARECMDTNLRLGLKYGNNENNQQH